MNDEEPDVIDFESSKEKHKQKEKKLTRIKRQFEKFLPLKKQPRVFKNKKPKKKK